jgi:hypothetical protein
LLGHEGYVGLSVICQLADFANHFFKKKVGLNSTKYLLSLKKEVIGY